MIDKDIIYNWVKENKLSKWERFKCRLCHFPFPCDLTIYNKEKYRKLEERYIKNMKNSNISADEYSVTFHRNATDLINILFKKYVDSNTLVITSPYEHHSVVDNIKKCQNVLYIDVFQDLPKKSLEEQKYYINTGAISSYDKIFVYLIGTHMLNGHTTDFNYFKVIKQICKEQNKQCICVLDDCQAMFILDHDYSIFDFIIGTGHSYLYNYNLGICVGKRKYGKIGHYFYNWGKTYITRLESLFKIKKYILSFHKIMAKYYNNYLKQFNGKYNVSGEAKTGHLFHITDNKPNYNKKEKKFIFKKFLIRLDNDNSFRIRSIIFVLRPKSLIKAVNYINDLLKKHEDLK